MPSPATRQLTHSVRPHRRARWVVACASLLVTVTGSGCSDDATANAAERGAATAAGATGPTAHTGADGSTGSTGATGADGTAGTPATNGVGAPSPAASTPPSVGDLPDPAPGVAADAPLAPAESGLPAGSPTNSRGAAITLDETALLACANNQFAWVFLRQGDRPRAEASLTVAAARAEASAIAEIASQAVQLRTAATATEPGATVDAFLDLCTQRGFEA